MRIYIVIFEEFITAKAVSFKWQFESTWYTRRITIRLRDNAVCSLLDAMIGTVARLVAEHRLFALSNKRHLRSRVPSNNK